MHTSEFHDIVLSPKHRTDAKEGLTLVSFRRDGRVTVRDSDGDLWRARAGEYLTDLQGHGSDYRLKSADRESGRVVIEGETRVYYSGNAPVMIAR